MPPTAKTPEHQEHVYAFDVERHAQLQEQIFESEKRIRGLADEERKAKQRLETLHLEESQMEKKLAPKREFAKALDTSVTGMLSSSVDIGHSREHARTAARGQHVEELRTIEKQAEVAREKLRTLNSDVAQAQKDKNALAPARRSYASVLRATAKANRTLSGVLSKIQLFQRKLKDLSDQATEAALAITKQWDEFAECCRLKTVDLDLREKDLVQREGDVSRREGWVKEKNESLRRAKAEIEAYHGHPLNHIIIPEE